MTYQIQPCSPKGLAKVLSDVGSGSTADLDQKYPTELLRVGECFCVPYADVKAAVLRSTISRQGKGSPKKFAVLDHPQFNCYEVVRVV